MHQGSRVFDITSIRSDFPVLSRRKMRGLPLIYLDSAATTQKPNCVIDAVSHFYSHDYASINRGVYELAESTTQQYELSRQVVADFLGAASASEIVFTSGTTESINLIAHGMGKAYLQAGDEIILTQMEHHANWVPWQQLVETVGVTLKIIPLTEHGEIDIEQVEALISAKTKLISMIHVSNVMGSIQPVEAIVSLAKSKNIPVLFDGAQAVAHIPVDVSALDCDFYVFSAHKLYGPTGVGVLYAKKKWLERMPPYQMGGDMIRQVSLEKTTFADPPQKFEAGTPNITGVIGTMAAVKYLQSFNWLDKQAHEKQLLAKLYDGLMTIKGVKVFGPEADKRLGLVSFIVDDVHAHDIGSLLGDQGIAVRVGHHCAMPLMAYLQVAATTRASIGLYNSVADIDGFLQGLDRSLSFFRG